MPAYAPGATVGPIVRLKESMENGSDYNLSELSMECHIGTHVDAPGHFNQAHFAAGLDVDTLDLEVLNGPALLVDVPRHTNITGFGVSLGVAPDSGVSMAPMMPSRMKRLLWASSLYVPVNERKHGLHLALHHLPDP
ncbi:hypothetical protein TRIUR3_24157 [Triticum urartu]|uniref:Kynurenine formamidase n=1 Tax=Triticum urartu TaxID=4572 RepID=M8A836_TRIUA|nr:hypothetical protein TRIUR3_24157 [Triticum urartu]